MSKQVCGVTVRDEVTHVVVHQSRETSAMGPKCVATIDGVRHEKLPIEQVTKDMICALWGPGKYALSLLAEVPDKTTYKRLGTTGAFEVKASKAVEATINGNGAPSAASNIPDKDASPFAIMEFVMRIQRDAQADARKDMNQQMERERAAFQTMASMFGTPKLDESKLAKLVKDAVDEALPEVDDERNDEEPPKWFQKALASGTEALKPIGKAIANKIGEGSS